MLRFLTVLMWVFLVPLLLGPVLIVAIAAGPVAVVLVFVVSVGGLVFVAVNSVVAVLLTLVSRLRSRRPVSAAEAREDVVPQHWVAAHEALVAARPQAVEAPAHIDRVADHEHRPDPRPLGMRVRGKRVADTRASRPRRRR
jgi:hypothetical protein